MDYPSPQRGRANLRRDVRAWYRGEHINWKRNWFNANRPTDLASDAVPASYRNRGQRVRRVTWRQAASRPPGARARPPVPRWPPRRGRRQTPGSMRAFMSPLESQNPPMFWEGLTNREAPDDQTKGASLAKRSNDQKVILSPLSGRSARRARLCAACVTFSAPVA
jgi:hypothetical protein